MTDLLTAAQDAIFDALNVPAVTDIAPVFQHVPEDTQPPVVIIGAMNRTAAGAKDSIMDRITIEIVTLYRAPSRRHVFELMAAVRDALEGKALTAIGATLSAPAEETAEDDLLPDGQTYTGVQRFALFASPAD